MSLDIIDPSVILGLVPLIILCILIIQIAISKKTKKRRQVEEFRWLKAQQETREARRRVVEARQLKERQKAQEAQHKDKVEYRQEGVYLAFFSPL